MFLIELEKFPIKMGSVVVLNIYYFCGGFFNFLVREVYISTGFWEWMLCVYGEFCLDFIIFCSSDYRANLDMSNTPSDSQDRYKFTQMDSRAANYCKRI